MSNGLERNLGEQPIAQVMAAHDLKAHDLVQASTEQLTHKMVARACKGRRLTPTMSGIRASISSRPSGAMAPPCSSRTLKPLSVGGLWLAVMLTAPAAPWATTA